MLKVFAAFLAPFILMIFFSLFNVFSMILSGNYSISFSLSGFLYVYIFAFPAYLLMGVPVSVIIERINLGLRWFHYSLAGAFAGFVLVFINSVGNSQGFVFTFEWAITYMVAGFSFYTALRGLEILDERLQNK
ncbi:hypothetical protein [Virgibacillus sp. YIM 98842]|uniref:hypothetical protein n=1 Tax=Virgibacillus sp. YIM 98842 TaxID=2663533 RepID=UPI0013DCA8F1|nr:hypothetical protein [Virgibacillus sp. YIM 98842]